MKKVFVILAIAGFILAACNNKKEEKKEGDKMDNKMSDSSNMNKMMTDSNATMK